jgi:predicted dehydrogenase
MKKIRIGIIGCGKVAERFHIPGYVQLGHAEVAAVCDTDLANARAVASLFNVPVIFNDYRHLLKLDDIKAVSVCTPNYLHCRMACDAIRAGRHVLVEKPMATSMAEVRRMLAAARTARRILMVSQNHRFFAINKAARDFVAAGRLGDVYAFRGRVGARGPEFWSPQGKWFFDRRQAFGGALADTGIHLIDLLRWISGKNVRTVAAFTKTLRKKCAVDDNASVIVTCTDGALGTIEVSWTQNPGELTYCLYGDRGTLINDNYQKLTFHAKDTASRELSVPKRLKEPTPYAHFVNCILNRRKPIIDGAEAAKSHEILFAAYKSAASGRAVKLPLA